MTEFGYALSSEEHTPLDLVRHARLAEEAGLTFALVSDHFHPWIDAQGHSAFVWSVLGGIAEATERMTVGTGVTCPTIRIHPAIIAHAAATAGAMLPGRFFLGVGTGENLNEHVLGDRWPGWEVRAEMLEEAIEVIRALWTGERTDHRGRYYEVESARLYTLPSTPIPIHIAAAGPDAAELAGRLGDGLIGTGPDKELFTAFDRAGGTGKPRFGQVTVCWASSEREARRTAHRIWPTAAIKGRASQELPEPRDFEALAEMVTEEDVAKEIVCGPDVEMHVASVRKYIDAGYDHVYLHQVGPDQEGFLDFVATELLPALAKETKRQVAASAR
jgi:coenzyme F420-dependent glucose-6-phosphate dehydrogenase